MDTDMLVIYGLKNCDSCRKAKKALGAEITDLRETGIPADVMAGAIAQFDAQLINKRSTTWRQIPEDARAETTAALLAAYPTVMKRPLIVDGDRMFLGWGKDTQAALLG